MEGKLDPVGQNLSWAVEAFSRRFANYLRSDAPSTDLKVEAIRRYSFARLSDTWQECRKFEDSLTVSQWDSLLKLLDDKIESFATGDWFVSAEDHRCIAQTTAFLRSACTAICFGLAPKLIQMEKPLGLFNNSSFQQFKDAKGFREQALTATTVADELRGNTRAALLLVEAVTGAHEKAGLVLEDVKEDLVRLANLAEEPFFKTVFKDIEEPQEHPLFSEVWDFYGSSLKDLRADDSDQIAQMLAWGFKTFGGNLLDVRGFIQGMRAFVASSKTQEYLKQGVGSSSGVSPLDALFEKFKRVMTPMSFNKVPNYCRVSQGYFQDERLDIYHSVFQECFSPESRSLEMEVALIFEQVRPRLQIKPTSVAAPTDLLVEFAYQVNLSPTRQERLYQKIRKRIGEGVTDYFHMDTIPPVLKFRGELGGGAKALLCHAGYFEENRVDQAKPTEEHKWKGKS